MKTLIAICLFIASVQVSAQTTNKEPNLKPTTLQGNGGPGITSQYPTTKDGNGGPGGDVHDDGKTDFYHVNQDVNTDPNFKEILKAIVRRMEYEYLRWPPDEDQKRMFSKNRDGKTVYQVIDEVNVNLLQSGYCIDRYGRQKDGASDLAHNEICISADGVISKSSFFTYSKKLYGLIIHEISHFMGAPEETPADTHMSEAESIQWAAERVMSNRVAEVLPEAVNLVESESNALLGLLNNIIQSVQSGKKDAAICGLLGAPFSIAATSFATEFDAAFQGGVTPLTLQQTALVERGLEMQIFISQMTFCGNQAYLESLLNSGKWDIGNMKPDRQGYVLLSDFFESFAPVLGSARVKLVQAGNRQELLENLTLIGNELKSFVTSLPKLHWWDRHL